MRYSVVAIVKVCKYAECANAVLKRFAGRSAGAYMRDGDLAREASVHRCALFGIRMWGSLSK